MVDYMKSSVDVPFYTLEEKKKHESESIRLSTSSKETESIFLKGQLNKKKLINKNNKILQYDWLQVVFNHLISEICMPPRISENMIKAFTAQDWISHVKTHIKYSEICIWLMKTHPETEMTKSIPEYSQHHTSWA